MPSAGTHEVRAHIAKSVVSKVSCCRFHAVRYAVRHFRGGAHSVMKTYGSAIQSFRCVFTLTFCGSSTTQMTRRLRDSSAQIPHGSVSVMLLQIEQ